MGYMCLGVDDSMRVECVEERCHGRGAPSPFRGLDSPRHEVQLVWVGSRVRVGPHRGKEKEGKTRPPLPLRKRKGPHR